MDLCVGKSFSDYKALKEAIDQHERLQNCEVWIRNSRRIGKPRAGKRIKKQIKPELIYYEITYRCVFGGSSKSKIRRAVWVWYACSLFSYWILDKGEFKYFFYSIGQRKSSLISCGLPISLKMEINYPYFHDWPQKYKFKRFLLYDSQDLCYSKIW